MNQRYITFLVFHGAHGRLRKIHLPPFVVQLVLGFALAGVVTVGALANSYARMLLKVSSYNTVRAEREALKTQCHSLQGEVTRTQDELESLQSLAAEVAMAYSFSKAESPSLPSEVLLVASRGLAAQGADYGAALRAFKMMKEIPPGASSSPAAAFYASEIVDEDSVTPSIWPVQGPITAGFGQRMDPFTGEGVFHSGIDIAAPGGTPVKAAADGILFYSGPDAGYGNEALIDHGFGVTTKYAHLSTLHVVAGQEVRRGQVIGAVGMTGRTTGPHLHYEVIVRGTPVNPARYLRD
ncbi:MAG TPA: M23 family metallopeptidase [Terriglobia bacterium]|nr:M23 family metallopeptidase [Terriglobia bacterium]